MADSTPATAPATVGGTAAAAAESRLVVALGAENRQRPVITLAMEDVAGRKPLRVI